MKNRIIFFPQYPSKMRYQEWWITEFPSRMEQYFDEIITLRGYDDIKDIKYNNDEFSPRDDSIRWDIDIVDQCLDIIEPDDILFFGDISYPGFATQVLYHLDNVVYGFCHATSQNYGDIFDSVRPSKFLVEQGVMSRMSGVFFGTQYSLEKAGSPGNGVVVGLPRPPYALSKDSRRHKFVDVGIVSRRTSQKVDPSVVKFVEDLGYSVAYHDHTTSDDWSDYLSWISGCKCVLSSAKEETFGYQVMDADIVGVPFVAPDKYGYREVVRDELRYSGLGSLASILNTVCSDNVPFKSSMSMWAQAKCSDWYNSVSSVILRNYGK